MREMKDSGIEWIGEIPLDWQAIKLKFVMDNFDYERIPVDSTKRSQDGEQLYDYYGASGVIDQIDGYTSEGERILIGEDGANLLLRNLPVIYIANGKYWVNNHAHILKPKGNGNLHFFANQMECIDYTEYITGSAQPKLSQSNLGQVWLVVPPVEEQNLISTYLDAKCSEIDALTADIQTQIDTLEQYKRSVITEAVTRGLYKNVEMKESGIEYVGKIPASWDMHPVYYYFGERKHKNSLGEEQNLLSLSYGNIIRKDINTREGLLPESFNTYNIVEAGDIIIRPTDLQNDKRSLRTGLVREHGIITSAYIDLMPVRNINTEYYHYLLHAFDVMKVFYNMGNGVRQGLNFSEFSRLMVFEPSLAEQNSIVDYLNDKCGQINTVISEKQDQLATLDAYKKSTIYEYVTGKKEVPAV